MDDRSGMSISADSPSDETLNRGLLALFLRRQYEFPFVINIAIFIFFMQVNMLYLTAENHLQDCSEIEDYRMSDDDTVNDYKKHTASRRRVSRFKL